jgi:hypothetical protein
METLDIAASAICKDAHRVYIRSKSYTHVTAHLDDDPATVINDIRYDLLSHGLKEEITILVVMK